MDLHDELRRNQHLASGTELALDRHDGAPGAASEKALVLSAQGVVNLGSLRVSLTTSPLDLRVKLVATLLVRGVALGEGPLVLREVFLELGQLARLGVAGFEDDQ